MHVGLQSIVKGTSVFLPTESFFQRVGRNAGTYPVLESHLLFLCILTLLALHFENDLLTVFKKK